MVLHLLASLQGCTEARRPQCHRDNTCPPEPQQQTQLLQPRRLRAWFSVGALQPCQCCWPSPPEAVLCTAPFPWVLQTVTSTPALALTLALPYFDGSAVSPVVPRDTTAQTDHRVLMEVSGTAALPLEVRADLSSCAERIISKVFFQPCSVCSSFNAVTSCL